MTYTLVKLPNWETQNDSVSAIALAGRSSFFVNTLTKWMKSAVIPKVFKTRLRSTLISEEIQNTDKFMVHDWDPCIADIWKE